MKKVANFLHKLNTPLFYAILSAVFGLAFLFLPRTVLDVLLIVAGVALSFVGLVLLSQVDAGTRDLGFYLEVIRGTAILLFGIVTAIARSATSRMLCSSLGLYILIKALPKLIRMITTTETRDGSWWKNMIISVIETVLGLWMTIYPIYPAKLTGVILIVLSIDTFLHIKWGSSRSFRSSSSSRIYYDAEFEDRS